MTFAELKTKLRGELWPFPNEPKPLITPHSAYFIAAMIEIQRWVPELQLNNLTQFGVADTKQECGMNVMKAPVGVIQRVYTTVGDLGCDAVFYDPCDWDKLRCAARNFLQRSIDTDGSTRSNFDARARLGERAIHNHNLYLFPWIQGNEKISVEWDGVKNVWVDADVLDSDWWDPIVEQLIKDYVQWRHYHFHTPDLQSAAKHKESFDQGLALTIYEFAQRTKQQGRKPCSSSLLATTQPKPPVFVDAQGNVFVDANGNEFTV